MISAEFFIPSRPSRSYFPDNSYHGPRCSWFGGNGGTEAGLDGKWNGNSNV